MFWGFALALVLIALAFIIPPLWRGKDVNDIVSRDKLNAVIFTERVAELENGGLNGEALQQSKQELEKNLASELGEDHTSELQIRARWAALIAAVFVPLLAIGGYWFSSADSRQLEQSALEQAEGVMPSLEEMIKGLQARLEKEPGNIEGWHMLARSYLVMERYQEANDVYEKMLQLTARQDPDVLANYAESLALANDENLQGKPVELLQEVLALEPKHIKGLWLAGMAAMQQGQSEEVGRLWHKLLPQIPPNSEDYQFIVQALASIGQLPEIPSSHPQEAPAAPPESNTTPAAHDSGAQITVQVTLAAELQAQAEPQDTVFIYARAAQGSRAPLAIVTDQVKNLPLNVTLTDEMAMIAGMNLSAFEEIILAARVSKSANANAQTGDLIGESAVLKRADIHDSVAVTISHIVE
jgi:cytochrome c-type biogenesis protein CcmH